MCPECMPRRVILLIPTLVVVFPIYCCYQAVKSVKERRAARARVRAYARAVAKQSMAAGRPDPNLSQSRRRRMQNEIIATMSKGDPNSVSALSLLLSMPLRTPESARKGVSVRSPA
ncbi:hypothetical protein DL93DRAFT_2159299 [Clavulina sp. PMI_390]|nr:hypothetical protein DL93DRAFT_2159299 [Clavulina sp. PMI_390]